MYTSILAQRTFIYCIAKISFSITMTKEARKPLMRFDEISIHANLLDCCPIICKCTVNNHMIIHVLLPFKTALIWMIQGKREFSRTKFSRLGNTRVATISYDTPQIQMYTTIDQVHTESFEKNIVWGRHHLLLSPAVCDFMLHFHKILISLIKW